MIGECGKVRYTGRMKTDEKKPARFAQRRDHWMRNLLASPLPSGTKAVGIRLALYMNEKKQFAHPSYDRLADACGLKARQAQSCCMKLERGGWLHIDHKRNAGNTYRLRYWWDE